MSQILLHLGLSPTGFKAGLKSATDQTKEFERGWKDLRKIFTAGGVATLAIGFLRAFSREAQETRRRLEEMGDPIPRTVAALANLGDAFDDLHKGSVMAVGGVLHAIKVYFEFFGTMHNRLRGISAEQEKIAAQAYADAEAAEKRLAEAKKANSPEKIAAAEEKLAELRRQSALQRATDEEREAMLLKENLEIREAIKVTIEKSLPGIRLREQLEKNLNELHRVGLVLEKKRADELRDAAADAQKKMDDDWNMWWDNQDRKKAAQKELNELAKKEAELRAQAAREQRGVAEAIRLSAEAARQSIGDQLHTSILRAGDRNYGAAIDSERLRRASDDELKELIRRQQLEIQYVESTKGTGASAGADAATNFLIQGAIQARLQTDIERARQELATRSDLRTDVARLGVAGARRRFEGNPLAFDRMVEEFASQRSELAQTNRILEDIRSRLGDSGRTDLPKTVESVADKLDRLGQTLTAGMSDLARRR